MIRLSVTLLLLLLACEGEPPPKPVPVDLDRQCTPERGCRDGLLCIRLVINKRAVDGGFSEMGYYTCHPRCSTDADCPADYRCVRPMPPPMEAVCVHKEVAAALQPDGGSP